MENSPVQGQIQGIIVPNASKMMTNHFADDSLLSLWAGQVVDSARDCVSMFFHASRALVSDCKTN